MVVDKGAGKKIGLFGVPFDPLPSKEALLIKQAYLQAKVRGWVSRAGYADPYGFFSNNLPPVVSGKCYLHGEVSVPTWLQPKPQPNDASKLTLDSLNTFIKSGGCRTIANEVHEFINKNIFPKIPGMIGVDHSCTYGVISALRKYHGEEELGLVVLDSHFDAVPMSLRYGLIEYVKETNIPSISPDPLSQGTLPSFSSQEIKEWEQLNAENFLLHVLEDKMIDPKNLILVGLSDYPGKAFEEIDDPRVKDYRDFFKSLEKKGTHFISKSSLSEHGKEHLENALQGLSTKKVYISLDIDIGSLSAVYACRFLNTSGLSFDQIRDVFQSLFSSLSNGLTLVGFDITEVDIHKLGFKTDSSHVDKTDEVGKLFLELVGKVS